MIRICRFHKISCIFQLRTLILFFHATFKHIRPSIGLAHDIVLRHTVIIFQFWRIVTKSITFGSKSISKSMLRMRNTFCIERWLQFRHFLILKMHLLLLISTTNSSCTEELPLRWLSQLHRFPLSVIGNIPGQRTQ